MSGETIFTVDLLGTSFTVSSKEERAHLERVVRFLREKISETKMRVPVDDPLKVSLITSLFLVDELIKVRDCATNEEEIDSANDKALVNDLASRLIDEIDQAMK